MFVISVSWLQRYENFGKIKQLNDVDFQQAFRTEPEFLISYASLCSPKGFDFDIE